MDHSCPIGLRNTVNIYPTINTVKPSLFATLIFQILLSHSINIQSEITLKYNSAKNSHFCPVCFKKKTNREGQALILGDLSVGKNNVLYDI